MVVDKYRLSFNLESPVDSAERAPDPPRGDLQERRRRWSGGAAFPNGGQVSPVPQLLAESPAEMTA